jgi:periplasmic protein TonB
MNLQKFTAITLGVAALHALTLWAVQSYRVPAITTSKADALVTRTVEPPKLVEAAPPPVALPLVKPPATPAATPAAMPPQPPQPLPKPTQPTPAPKAAQAAQVAQAATVPLPTALNNSRPTPNVPLGSAPPAAAAPATNALNTDAQTPSPTPPAAAKAPAQAPVTLQPSTDADHVDTQYRIALPAISARLREQGRVWVRVQVSVDGRVLQVQLLKSSGYARLDDNALATVARWRFKPGSVNGVPTMGWVEQPVDYAVQ